MAQTAANLIDHVLPQNVSLRQWVLTFPFELRAQLGFDAELLSALCGVVNDALLALYQRALRERVEPLLATDDDAPTRRRKLQSGTVTVVQRTSSDLRLNPHLHILALDGVFAQQPDDPPRFVPLPTLASIDVAELLVTIRTRVLRLLAQRGVIDTSQDLALLPSEQADADPVLVHLATAAVSGTAPAGPERRQRAPIHLAHSQRAIIPGPLCATDSPAQVRVRPCFGRPMAKSHRVHESPIASSRSLLTWLSSS
jgi:hypothetical protein